MSSLGRTVGLGIKARWGLSLDAGKEGHAEERANEGVRRAVPGAGGGGMSEPEKDRSGASPLDGKSPSSAGGLGAWMRRCISAGAAVSLSPPAYRSKTGSSAAGSLPLSRGHSDGASSTTSGTYDASSESDGSHDHSQSEASPTKPSDHLITFTPAEGGQTTLPYLTGTSRRRRRHRSRQWRWPSKIPAAAATFGITRKVQKAAQYWVLAFLLFIVGLQIINLVVPAESGDYPDTFEYRLERLRNRIKTQGSTWLSQVWRSRWGHGSSGTRRGGRDELAIGLWPPNEYAETAQAVREGVLAGPSTTVPPGTRFGPPPHLATLPEDLLHLTKGELSEMRRYRQANLWEPPLKELETVVIPPRSGHSHEATVIFLHGLDQHVGHAFMPHIFTHLHPTIRFVMPQGPSMRSEAHDGAIVSGWFHIQSFPYDPEDRDDEFLFRAARGLKSIIARERTRLIRKERGLMADGEADDYDDDEGFGTPGERKRAMKRIFLSGFSQGSVVSLLTAFTHPETLGGVVVLSGFLPVRTDLARLSADLDRSNLPIFWGHGVDDEFCSLNDAVQSMSLLSPQALPTFFYPSEALPETSLFYTNPWYRLNNNHTTFRFYDELRHIYHIPLLQDLERWFEEVLPREARSGNGTATTTPRRARTIEQLDRRGLSRRRRKE